MKARNSQCTDEIPERRGRSGGPIEALYQQHGTGTDNLMNPTFPNKSPISFQVGRKSFLGEKQHLTTYSWGDQLNNSWDFKHPSRDEVFSSPKPARRLNTEACQQLNSSVYEDLYGIQRTGSAFSSSRSTSRNAVSPLKSYLDKSFTRQKTNPTIITTAELPVTDVTVERGQNFLERNRAYAYRGTRSQSLNDVLNVGRQPSFFTSSDHPLASPTLLETQGKVRNAYCKNPRMYIKQNGLSTLISPLQDKPARTLENATRKQNHWRKTCEVTEWKAKQVLHNEHKIPADERFMKSISNSSRCVTVPNSREQWTTSPAPDARKKKGFAKTQMRAQWKKASH